jgi:sec-independent protein translocase protein TatC
VAFSQLWRYVSPGLYQHEQRAAKLFVGLSSLFFFMGVIFSYQVVVPFMFDYNLDFSRTQDDYKLLADITLEDYFDSFKMMILSIGVSFTTPILLAALSYVELLAYESLRSAWRWSTVGSFVVAAILTPPDYITQTLVALPLNGLYWVGVLLAFLIEKNREKG